MEQWGISRILEVELCGMYAKKQALFFPLAGEKRACLLFTRFPKWKCGFIRVR